jgi:hypothetical protein
MAVAATMGRIRPGARAAVPFLRHTLLSPGADTNTCSRAAVALWRIEGSTDVSLPLLIADLGSTRMEAAVAAHALAEIGPTAGEAIPALRRRLEATGFFGLMWVRLDARGHSGGSADDRSRLPRA